MKLTQKEFELIVANLTRRQSFIQYQLIKKQVLLTNNYIFTLQNEYKQNEKLKTKLYKNYDYFCDGGNIDEISKNAFKVNENFIPLNKEN